MRKYLLIVFVVALVVILIQVWLNKFVWNKKSSLPETPRNRPFAKETIYQETPTPYFAGTIIIYQEADDKEERTVIYQNNAYPYSGIGDIYAGDKKLSKLQYTVGLFSGWEKIAGSKDRYLLLYDPIEKKDLRKIRIAYEPLPVSDDKCVESTELLVESPGSGKIKSTNKRVLNVSSLDVLLKSGDAVVLQFPSSSKGRVVIDKSQIVCAVKLVIRRKAGLEEKEYN